MGEKKQKKRRKINTARLMLVLVLVLLLLIGFYALLNSNIFNIKDIQIKGNKQVEYEKIVSYLRLNNEKNIFMNSTKEMEARLKENPYIDEVTVEKKFPNSLEIDIKERKPVAILKSGNTYCYMDKKGELLEVISKVNDRSIIVNIPYSIKENKEIKFKNEEIEKRILYLLECIDKKSLSQKIYSIELENADIITMTTKDRIEILLYNDEKISYNISRISVILAELQNENIKVGTIDLTCNDYAVYKP